mgnify:FL=1|jgi:hypothetical protein|tara:strand:+ start:408 stop:1034 length:627 start_codon:yes stop_codon:yes gene_type:complete
MEIYLNKSKKPKTPFAPKWNYHIGCELISHIDFKKIAKIILKKEKLILKKFPSSNRLNVDGYTGLGKDSLTSRHEHFNIFSWPEAEIKKLKPSILDFYSRFLNKIKIKGVSNFEIKGWANVMRKGESIKAHLHATGPKSYLSGNISVQCEKTATYYINPVNQINAPFSQQIINKAGQIVLFPSCVPHYTDIHLGNKERITIAFDFIVK